METGVANENKRKSRSLAKQAKRSRSKNTSRDFSRKDFSENLEADEVNEKLSKSLDKRKKREEEEEDNPFAAEKIESDEIEAEVNQEDSKDLAAANPMNFSVEIVKSKTKALIKSDKARFSNIEQTQAALARLKTLSEKKKVNRMTAIKPMDRQIKI